MSESGIRRIVHAAYEQEAAVHCDVGLYADERIRNFFAQIKTIMNETFQSLNDSLQQYPLSERSRRLAKGLAFLASDQNQALSQDELARATQEFPNIAHEYKRAMVRYAQCMISQKSADVKVECTPFDTFLFKMYKRIATSPEVRSARYFTMSYMEQEIFLKDVMRMTMGACLTIKPQPPQSPSSSVTMSAGDVVPSSHRSRPVTPFDSVSNIVPNLTGASPLPSRRTTTALDNALSVATQEDDRDAGSLTAFSLTQHKQRLAQREREREQPTKARARPFTPASVAPSGGARESQFEKEIEIETQAGHAGLGVHGGGGGGNAASGFFAPSGGKRTHAASSPSEFVFEDDTSASD